MTDGESNVPLTFYLRNTLYLSFYSICQARIRITTDEKTLLSCSCRKAEGLDKPSEISWLHEPRTQYKSIIFCI